LNFSNIVNGLESTGNAPEQFLIAGEDRKFVPAIAKIEGCTIVIWEKEVKNPVAVRFCFDDNLLPDVFSTEGLPLAPFRTDSW
jgi:sialate O-acetylesterase